MAPGRSGARVPAQPARPTRGGAADRRPGSRAARHPAPPRAGGGLRLEHAGDAGERARGALTSPPPNPRLLPQRLPASRRGLRPDATGRRPALGPRVVPLAGDRRGPRPQRSPRGPRARHPSRSGSGALCSGRGAGRRGDAGPRRDRGLEASRPGARHRSTGRPRRSPDLRLRAGGRPARRARSAAPRASCAGAPSAPICAGGCTSTARSPTRPAPCAGRAACCTAPIGSPSAWPWSRRWPAVCRWSPRMPAGPREIVDVELRCPLPARRRRRRRCCADRRPVFPGAQGGAVGRGREHARSASSIGSAHAWPTASSWPS